MGRLQPEAPAAVVRVRRGGGCGVSARFALAKDKSPGASAPDGKIVASEVHLMVVRKRRFDAYEAIRGYHCQQK